MRDVRKTKGEVVGGALLVKINMFNIEQSFHTILQYRSSKRSLVIWGEEEGANNKRTVHSNKQLNRHRIGPFAPQLEHLLVALCCGRAAPCWQSASV
jgi:hypothetical protein